MSVESKSQSYLSFGRHNARTVLDCHIGLPKPMTACLPLVTALNCEFSWIGFGPDESIDTDAVRDYLQLPYMVLGAVMAGWVFLMIQIVRGPLTEGFAWAWTFLVRSLSLWFILDTGMSLVLGYPMHALFNLPFALALGIPLAQLRPIR